MVCSKPLVASTEGIGEFKLCRAPTLRPYVPSSFFTGSHAPRQLPGHGPRVPGPVAACRPEGAGRGGASCERHPALLRPSARLGSLRLRLFGSPGHGLRWGLGGQRPRGSVVRRAKVLDEFRPPCRAAWDAWGVCEHSARMDKTAWSLRK